MKRFLSLAAVVGLILGAVPALEAAEASSAKVTRILGEARVLKAGETEWKTLETDAVLRQGDQIQTSEKGSVMLILEGSDKTAEVVVKGSSEVRFEEFTFDRARKTDSTLLDVSLGSVLVKAEKFSGESKFEVKTPTSIVGIRGTVFEVQVSKA